MNQKIKKIAVASTIAATLAFTACTNKETKTFIERLEKNDFADAVRYYNKNTKKIKYENVLPNITASVEEIFDEFMSQDMSTADALTNLNLFRDMSEGDLEKDIKKKIEKVTKIGESRDNFEKGNFYEQDNDFITAIKFFKEVIEEDKDNFTKAQQKIKDCVKEYENKIIADADQYISKENYLNAMNIIKSGAEQLDDKTNLNAKLTEIENKYKDQLIKEADKYVSNKNFDEAISYLKNRANDFTDKEIFNEKIKEIDTAKLEERLGDTKTDIKNQNYHDAIEKINALEEEFEGNEALAELKKTTIDSYIKETLPKIDKYMEDKDYLNAYNICKPALDILPENEELTSRMAEIEKYKPTLLSEITISESQDFEQLTSHDEIYKDCLGNIYNPGNLYAMNIGSEGWSESANGYAKIYANAQYKAFKGTIALNDTSATGDIVVTIYVDEEVAYTGTFNRTTEPAAIDIDITDKQWIMVKLTYPEEDQNYKSSIFLSNFGLYK